jgi:hypothetical protein
MIHRFDDATCTDHGQTIAGTPLDIKSFVASGEQK